MNEDERKLLQGHGYRWQLVSPDGAIVSVHDASEKVQAEEEAPEHHAVISDEGFHSVGEGGRQIRPRANEG